VEEAPMFNVLVLNDSQLEPKIIKYATTSLNILRSSYQNYLRNINDFDVIRSIFHAFYDAVHSNSIDTLLVSKGFIKEFTEHKLKNKNKLKNKTYSGCKDHYYIPQNLGRICYQYPEIYLKNPDKFFDLFCMFTQTRLITPEENKRLSNYTKSGKKINGKKVDNLEFVCSLETRYEKADIQLFQRQFGPNWIKKDLIPTPSKIELNKELKEFESLFINRELI
jgi:hypothetical protein